MTVEGREGTRYGGLNTVGFECKKKKKLKRFEAKAPPGSCLRKLPVGR